MRGLVGNPSGWAAEITTGIVCFDVTPEHGVTVTAGFELDTHVCFDTDTIDLTLDPERTAISLIKVRRA